MGAVQIFEFQEIDALESIEKFIINSSWASMHCIHSGTVKNNLKQWEAL